MKLARLLELHNQNSPENHIVTNLGDGYLIKNNPIYRAIRTQSAQFSFTFTSEPNAAYTALPLTQLEVVLRNKSIPYVDNVTVLTQLEAMAPNLATWEEIKDNLKPNYLFHESCHAVARSAGAHLISRERHDDERLEYLVTMLLEESFANACELMAVIYIEESTHRIFFEINSYSHMYDARFILTALAKEMGTQSLFQFLVYTYLYSNFLRERLSDSELETVLHLIGIDENLLKSSKVLRSVSKIPFKLNLRFRTVTSLFHLRLCGFKFSPDEMLKFDFMNTIKSHSKWQDWVAHLAAKTILD